MSAAEQATEGWAVAESLASVETDEAAERPALAAAAARLEQLVATVVTLAGEVSPCAASALRPMRRADIGVRGLVEASDVHGVYIGADVRLSRGCKIKCSGTDNTVILAPNVRLSQVSIVVRGNGNLIYVGADSTLNDVTIKVLGDDNTVAVGRNVTYESGSLVCARTGRAVLVGDNCLLSRAVVVRTTDRPGVPASGGSLSDLSGEDIVIGADVWLGEECRVNDGARIGTGTVVGGLSKVAGSLAPHCLYAGAPARRLFPQPGPDDRLAALAATEAADEDARAALAAASAADEAEERTALAAAASRLEQLAATVAALAGEVSPCAASALRPMRRADIGERVLVDGTDPRMLCVGEGVSVSSRCSIDSTGKDNVIVLAANVRLHKVTITVRGNGNLIYIGPGARLSNTLIKAVGDGNTIAVGSDVTFESGALLCERHGRSLLLGDDCMVSNSVVVRTSDHHGIFERSSGSRLNPSADVVIGAHVWLGNGCRINKGTRIGSGAVVGQTAIASGILEPNCVYAGVPARKLREDVVWSRSERLDDVPDRFR